MRLGVAVLPALALAVLAMGAVACGSDDESGSGDTGSPPTDQTARNTPNAPTEVFRMGGILPLTGDLSLLAPPLVNAAELAVREINDAGFQTIDYRLLDSGTNAEIGNNAADTHIAANVHGMLGPSSSLVSLATVDKIAGAGIPMISPTATTPLLTDYPDNGLYFRTSISDVLQGQVMANLAINEGGQDVSILYRADDYGRALAEIAKMSLENGGASVPEFVSYDPAGSTFQAEVQQIISSGSDSLILIAFNEGFNMIRQLIEGGFSPPDFNIFVPDGLAVGNLGERVDPQNPGAVEGILGTRPGTPAESESTFSDRYQEEFPGEDELFAPHAFDAVTILALAALAAGSNAPSDYASGIIGITRDGTACDRYAECAQLIMDGVDIDYNGASGLLDFTEAGEPSIGTYDIASYNAEGGFDIIGQESADLLG